MAELRLAKKDRIEGNTIILHDVPDSDNPLFWPLKIITTNGEKEYRILKTKGGKYQMCK